MAALNAKPCYFPCYFGSGDVIFNPGDKAGGEQGLAEKNRGKKAKPVKGVPGLPGRRAVLITLFVAVAAVILLAGAASFISRPRLFDYRQLLMDTDVSLQIFAGNSGKAGRAKEKLFDEMKRLEQLLSYTDPSSDVTRINGAAGKGPVQVSPETAEVIQKALRSASLSEGAFDPTVAPLLELWGFPGDDFRVPRAEEIEEKRLLVDYRLVQSDADAGTVFLPRSGMALDLGGIAKGYIDVYKRQLLRLSPWAPAGCRRLTRPDAPAAASAAMPVPAASSA